MKKLLSGSLAAAWLACGVAAAAQSTSATPSSPRSADQPSPATTIILAGCVQHETTVLTRHPAVGEVGMTDEFVLTHSILNPRPRADRATDQTEPTVETPVGTSGTTSNLGKVYRVTGDREKELKLYVGQRIEITGAFKNDFDAKEELAAVIPGARSITDPLTPANAPEITITAIRPVPGPCTIGSGR
jgi:hypothetical protein